MKNKGDGAVLRVAMTKYGVSDYTIVEKKGVRVAVFGIMAEESISNAPESGVTWKDGTERAKEIVAESSETGMRT